MARSAATATGPSGAVRTVLAALAVVGLALVVLLIVRARPGPEPFDPRSGQPSGARGLVLLLDAAGADVIDTEAVPFPGDDVRVLVLDDRLDADQRSDLVDFVEAGGVAIVADPDSSLHGGSGVDGGAIRVSRQLDVTDVRNEVDREANIAPGRCTIDALGDVRGVYARDGVLFPVGPDEPQCLTDRDGVDPDGLHSFVIVREVGAGLVVGLGDNEPFVNSDLRRADNAALAVSLLVPEVGTEVAIVIGTGITTSVQDVGSGDETLRDLVPNWVWMSLVLGAVSFVVLAGSRAVRVGQVVDEPLAVPIAGSELVSATGNLMQRAKHARRAGTILTTRTHRELCIRHGVPVETSTQELDRVVSERTGRPVGHLTHVLVQDVNDEAGLLALARRLDTVRNDPTRDATPERVPTP